MSIVNSETRLKRLSIIPRPRSYSCAPTTVTSRELADGQVVRHEDAGVDFGRIGFASGHAGRLRPARGAASRSRPRFVPGRCGAAGPSLFSSAIPSCAAAGGPRAWPRACLPRANSLKTPSRSKRVSSMNCEQRLEILRRLAGKSGDERRAQRDARNARADALDQVADMLRRRFAPHRLEHRIGNVLERHVDVARDLGALGDGPDQLVAPVGRVGVEQPDPEIALDLLQLAQQVGERIAPRRIDRRARPGLFLPAVHAEIGRVLRNEIELLHALGHEPRAPRPRSKRPCGCDAVRASAG